MRDFKEIRVAVAGTGYVGLQQGGGITYRNP